MSHHHLLRALAVLGLAALLARPAGAQISLDGAGVELLFAVEGARGRHPAKASLGYVELNPQAYSVACFYYSYSFPSGSRNRVRIIGTVEVRRSGAVVERRIARGKVRKRPSFVSACAQLTEPPPVGATVIWNFRFKRRKGMLRGDNFRIGLPYRPPS